MRRDLVLVTTIAVFVTIGCGAAKRASTSKPGSVDAGGFESSQARSAAERAPVHAKAELFVLARCPHGAEVLRTFIGLKEELGSSLDLSIRYLGELDDDGNPDQSAGDAEIASATAQICAREVGDEAAWLAFLKCLYAGETWRSLPSSWPECAQSAGIDEESVRQCMSSGQGTNLLVTDYAESAENQIVASPTVIIDNRVYLGGRSGEEILRHLCHLTGSEQTRPARCYRVEPPAEVAATLLYDSRCADPELCDVSHEIVLLSVLVPGLKLAQLDYATEEGAHLYELIQKASEVKELPLMVIDQALEREKAVFERLRDYLVPFGRGYLFIMGNGWDPKAEICDNQVDDTGDGKIDCQDPGCAGALQCRDEKPGRLDLFIMSECPFAAEMLPSVDRFLDHFDRNRKEVDFYLQFIADIDEDGQLSSMHGQAEVDEDLRMICAQDLYGRDYRFMEYIVCRAQQGGSGEYASCIPKWMNRARFERCATGKQGKELLKTSMELARDLGVEASPTLLLNNRVLMDERTAKALVIAFCEHNEPRACTEEVAPEPEPSGSAVTGDKCE